MLKKSLLTLGAATATLAMVAAPAMADRDARDATGQSKFTFNMKTLNQLNTESCGFLSASPLGDAQVVPTAKTLQVLLPVTKVTLKDNQPNAIRIAHAGSGVELQNACYDVKLTGFEIQNFSDPDQTASYDVVAKTKSVDENSREVLFTMDLTGAVTGTSDHRGNFTKQRISSAALLLAGDGAAEFNQLVTGDESTGPFSQNDKVGAAKTQVKYAN